METAGLRERIAIEQARLEEYEAALVAEEKRLVEDITAQRIALETKRASAKVSMSDVEARTEAEKAELRALSTQIKRLSRAEQAGVARHSTNPRLCAPDGHAWSRALNWPPAR